MKTSFLFVVATLTSLSASICLADVIVLKDGTRIAGDIKKGEKGYIINKPGGQFDLIPFDVVKSLELSNSVAPADVARENLASLRRSVEHDDNIFRIVGRYQQFINRSTDSAVIELAKQDMAVWQQRKDAGLTKYGSQWVDDEQLAKLKVKTMQTADAARRQYKAGHFAEAESSVNQALSEDPKLPTALYIKGLLLYRVDQLPQARKTFELVNNLAPNHTPTLNNLAVVMSRQNQTAAALGMFDTAMLQGPKNRQLLDNIAELLNALPDEQRGTQIAQRVARHFTEQDVDLQKELSPQGLRRWGATWVTAEQLETLKVAERAVKDKLDQLSTEFDATKLRINNIDRDIDDNERSMRRMETSAYARDYFGNIYQSSLPATYYQLMDDNQKLQRQRDEQFAQLERLRSQARNVNADLPVPKYTGIQKLFDADSAPTVAPKGAVTAPAEAPTTQPT